MEEVIPIIHHESGRKADGKKTCLIIFIIFLIALSIVLGFGYYKVKTWISNFASSARQATGQN